MNEQFYITIQPIGKNRTCQIFDNNKNGYSPDLGVCYIEIGDIPTTIRYADNDKMFKGIITVIIQYTEEPAEITVSTLDNKISKTLNLGGTPECSDVGIFRLYKK